MSGERTPRSWRADLEVRRSEFYFGARWTREKRKLGELLTISVCVLPCLPLRLTCLTYDETEADA